MLFIFPSVDPLLFAICWLAQLVFQVDVKERIFVVRADSRLFTIIARVHLHHNQFLHQVHARHAPLLDKSVTVVAHSVVLL